MIENPTTSNLDLHKSIHLGSKINLIYYWYPILKYKRRIPELETKYYLLSVDMVLQLNDRNFDRYLREDQLILNIIDLIRNNIINSIFNKNDSIKLLNLIITSPLPKLIDKFYNYLIQDLNSPCIESENCDEISNFILSY